MKKIDRSEAERLYADWIVEKGNPHYFVFQVIRQWENWELADQIQDATGEEIEIEDEE